MKKQVIWIVQLLTLLLVSCKNDKMIVESNITIKNCTFDKVCYHLSKKDTTVITAFTEKDIIFDNYPCKSGWIHFTKSWNLKFFCLSSDYKILNNRFKKNTWIKFTEKSMICVLPEDMQIQGYTCRGGGGYKGISTSFYLSGELESFFPPEDIEIGNILCKSTLFGPVYLYEDGMLKQCVLAENTKINGKTYSKNSVLTFDKNGNVIFFN